MPMKCEEVYHFLQAYLDGEIGPEEERKLEAHVRLCPSCKKKLFSLQGLITSIEDLDEARPDEGFTKRLIERLPEIAEPARRTDRGGFWRRFLGPRPRG